MGGWDIVPCILEVAYTYPAKYTASLSEEINLNKVLYGQRCNLEVDKSLFSISQNFGVFEVV